MTPLDPDDPTSIELTAKIVPVGRVQERMANANGTLAGLLGADRFARQERPPEKAPAPAVAAPAISVSTAASMLRQPRAIRRALLRQHHHALGILGICGTGLVALLTAAALSLKAHALGHPRRAHADSVETLTLHATHNPAPRGTPR
jgi:dienelactone hydrolase